MQKTIIQIITEKIENKEYIKLYDMCSLDGKAKNKMLAPKEAYDKFATMTIEMLGHLGYGLLVVTDQKIICLFPNCSHKTQGATNLLTYANKLMHIYFNGRIVPILFLHDVAVKTDPIDFTREIGQLLKKHRNMIKMSRTDLAKLLLNGEGGERDVFNLTRVIQSYEKRGVNPPIHRFFKICKILGAESLLTDAYNLIGE